MAYIAEPSGHRTSGGDEGESVRTAGLHSREDVLAGDEGESRGISRGDVRCLLMHGFNGEPVDMWELEARLVDLGYAAKNLQLPGHGTSARDFAEHGWDDWFGHVREEAERVIERGERVVLIGHSMGAAVALAVAAAEPRIAGVAALCPPLQLSTNVLHIVRAVKRFVPYFPSGPEDVRDRRGARRRYYRNAYTWTATTTVESLLAALPDLHAALPRVACPTLVVCARNDHVVPLRDGLETFQQIGSDEKELLVLERSFHAVTKDLERHLVFERVSRFCDRVYAGAPRDEA
jgi:carboxylesterase